MIQIFTVADAAAADRIFDARFGVAWMLGVLA
jgi:hypothetical protein